jgi:hypothetical protein
VLQFANAPAMLQIRPEKRLAGLRSCRIVPCHDVWALQLNSRAYEERGISGASTLFFPVLEEAITYAERHGLAYRIEGVRLPLARKRGRSAS